MMWTAILVLGLGCNHWLNARRRVTDIKDTADSDAASITIPNKLDADTQYF